MIIISTPHEPSIDRFFIAANLFTFCNILSGSIGIYFAFLGDVSMALRLMLMGEVCDFFDGPLAKRSQYKTDFGEYLDSLADLITFVLLPASMMLQTTLLFEDIQIPLINFPIGYFCVIIFVGGGAGRLIRYAIRPTKSQFEGLPTAAAAMFMGALIVLITEPMLAGGNNSVSLAAVILGILMISAVSYPSPKRMFSSDNYLILFAGFLGFLYILIPHVLTALSLFAISLLYISAGPIYYRITERLSKKDPV